MHFDSNACRHSCFYPSGQYYTGHILSGKSYEAEGLFILSSLFHDMNGGSVTCTVTGQKHLFRRNHVKVGFVSSESIHVKTEQPKFRSYNRLTCGLKVKMMTF